MQLILKRNWPLILAINPINISTVLVILRFPFLLATFDRLSLMFLSNTHAIGPIQRGVLAFSPKRDVVHKMQIACDPFNCFRVDFLQFFGLFPMSSVQS